MIAAPGTRFSTMWEDLSRGFVAVPIAAIVIACYTPTRGHK